MIWEIKERNKGITNMGGWFVLASSQDTYACGYRKHLFDSYKVWVVIVSCLFASVSVQFRCADVGETHSHAYIHFGGKRKEWQQNKKATKYTWWWW